MKKKLCVLRNVTEGETHGSDAARIGVATRSAGRIDEVNRAAQKAVFAAGKKAVFRIVLPAGQKMRRP